MKKIHFNEFNYVLNAYPVEMLVSDEDYKRLENNEVTLEDLISENNNLEYGVAEPLYDISYLDENEPYELLNVEEID